MAWEGTRPPPPPPPLPSPHPRPPTFPTFPLYLPSHQTFSLHSLFQAWWWWCVVSCFTGETTRPLPRLVYRYLHTCAFSCFPPTMISFSPPTAGHTCHYTTCTLPHLHTLPFPSPMPFHSLCLALWTGNVLACGFCVPTFYQHPHALYTPPVPSLSTYYPHAYLPLLPAFTLLPFPTYSPYHHLPASMALLPPRLHTPFLPMAWLCRPSATCFLSFASRRDIQVGFFAVV